MVIFNSYVKLPEGMQIVISKHGEIDTIVGYIFDALDNMKMIQNRVSPTRFGVYACALKFRPLNFSNMISPQIRTGKKWL
jgi:hypothetical protein